eukprot:scaffold688_cov131-Skeletonema_marinoi.AAC.2
MHQHQRIVMIQSGGSQLTLTLIEQTDRTKTKGWRWSGSRSGTEYANAITSGASLLLMMKLNPKICCAHQGRSLFRRFYTHSKTKISRCSRNAGRRKPMELELVAEKESKGKAQQSSAKGQQCKNPFLLLMHGSVDVESKSKRPGRFKFKCVTGIFDGDRQTQKLSAR